MFVFWHNLTVHVKVRVTLQVAAAVGPTDNAGPQEEPDMADDEGRVAGIPDQVDEDAVRRAHEEQQAERDREEAIANGWLKGDPGDPQEQRSSGTAKRLYTQNEQRDFRA